MSDRRNIELDPLRIATGGLTEGLRLTLAEEAYGLPMHTELNIERTGLQLELIVEGEGEADWIRPLLPNGMAGECIRPSTMVVIAKKWGQVTIHLNGSGSTRTMMTFQGAKRYSSRLGVHKVDCASVEDSSPPVWACAVLGGAFRTGNAHRLWSDCGEYSVEHRSLFQHGDYQFTTQMGGDKASTDHAVLNLGDHYDGKVRVGQFDDAHTAIPRPGFVSFAGQRPPNAESDLLNGIICGLSLLFGVAPCLVAWIARDADGKICAWTLRSGYSPALDVDPTPVARFVHDGAPIVIRRESLSRAMRAYLDHRAPFKLDRVAWLASHSHTGPIDRRGAALRAALETLVEAGSPETPRNIIDRKQATPLLTELTKTLRDWAQANGISQKDTKRLTSKLNNVNETSSLARLPALLEAHGLTFAVVERNAWDFSNCCVHAALVALDGGEEMMLRFSALQATFGRIVVGVLSLHDHYIDYSTSGFPSRPISQAVGGEDGNESNIMRLSAGGSNA